ncbi:hypothetical protein SAMN04489859_10373 [Paracoccus alcaliphilus]|uniref:Uncharacterized protein n=1 Tax=Paracoccus alcaliphilus TaxID=34002 RepID=A0A1H8M723_9RHOB|nr:hypothetical protein [Paracoccus alcaliphilus]SEO13143.1 hypothetical protein SAMN04489859_10373 [Paracoccus alcaliphilus]
MQSHRFLKTQGRRDRDRHRGKLGKGRFDALVKELVAVIRLAFEAGATATLFGLEGPLRHGIRSDLCRQGWKWQDADDMAREILATAFRRVNATRPSWNEGQLEWTIQAGTLIGRASCARCHKPLPDGRPKFCSDLCKQSHHNHLNKLKEMSEDQVVRSSIRWI